MKMTKALAKYIANRNIDVDQLAADTNVSKAKLQETTTIPLDAEELLRVCQKLKVTPESLKGEL